MLYSCTNVLCGHEAEISRCKINSQGTMVVSGSFDGRTILWDLRKMKYYKIFQGQSSQKESVSIHCYNISVHYSSLPDKVRVIMDYRNLNFIFNISRIYIKKTECNLFKNLKRNVIKTMYI